LSKSGIVETHWVARPRRTRVLKGPPPIPSTLLSIKNRKGKVERERCQHRKTGRWNRMIAQGFFLSGQVCLFCSIFFRGHFSAAVAAVLPIKNYDSSYVPLGFFMRKKGRKKKKGLDKRQKSRHATRQEVHVIEGGSGRQRQGVGCRCFGSVFKRKGKRKKKKT